jgi:hypothetical protein
VCDGSSGMALVLSVPAVPGPSRLTTVADRPRPGEGEPVESSKKE